jgi:hypothetical protein
VWQKLTVECDFAVRVEFDSTNQLFVDSPNVLTLTSGDSWNDYGFAEGDSILFQWNHVDTSGSQPIKWYNVIGSFSVPADSLIIDRIENEKAFVVDVNGNPINFNLWSNIFPAQFGDFAVADCSVVTISKPQGIRFTYGHVENSQFQNGDLSSFIDGSLTEFLAEDTDTMPTGFSKPMTAIGQQSGMSVAFCNLKYISQQNEYFTYEIEISFMISSFFDNITTFQNDVSPPQTFDANSLTDNFKIIGFPVYNNPNIKIQTDLSDTAKLGNTGWFDENFNGLTNPFTVKSVTYQNASLTTVSSLDYANTIKMTAIVDGVQNLKMNTGGNADSFSDVFTVQLGSTPDPTVRSGYGIDNALMNVQNVLFERTALNEITFSADFIPTPEFFTFMDAKDITRHVH